MEVSQIKKYIHNQVDTIDEKFLMVIFSMLKTYNEDDDKIIGYNANGSIITKKEMLANLKKSESEIENGIFTKHEDLKNEIEKW